MSLATWYSNQYSTWNRTRRIQQTPFLARANTNVSRTATAITQGNNGAVTINMGDASDPAGKDKEKKPDSSLFGPNIGIVSSGPTWTEINEKKILDDELTPDIVNSWIEKSKESNQPTTTLQALVNLKRPTLRLSPLADDPSQADSHHHHGLEFEYDCDAPKCGIYVHVLLSADHPEAPSGASSLSGLTKVLVFETVTEGGFGKILKLEEGAMLELGRFEHIAATGDSTATALSSTSLNPVGENAATNTNESASGNTNRRRRFTDFHFLKRSHGRSVSGPALAIVDAEPATTASSDSKGKNVEEDEGVRVMIRLAALDDQGTELSSPNEQVTYLHVVRFGHREEGDEDTRPWVVKVVKREATIGPHTFHLHEIYGLSSSSASTSKPAPTAPLPTSASPTAHTYPPDSSQLAAITPLPTRTEDEPSSECLLCLSSPREVVLLPCRHLVACKECAINMVEFGAGGAIVHAEDTVNSVGADGTTAAAATPSALEAGTDATPDVGEATPDADAPPPHTPAVPPAAPPAPTPTVATRRKRKAKGWFCPVCRQPYTSLLRITTTPPPPAEGKESDSAEGGSGGPLSAVGVTVPPAAAGQSQRSNVGGLLGTGFRPGFFRGMSNRLPAGGADLERGL